MVTQEPHDSTQQPAPISIGQDVYTADGVKVGSIADIEPAAFTLARGPLVPPERVVPRAAVSSIDANGVRLLMTLAQVESDTHPAQLPRHGAPTFGAMTEPVPGAPPASEPSQRGMGAADVAGAPGMPGGPVAQRPQVPPLLPEPPVGARAARDARDVDAAAFRENTIRKPPAGFANPRQVPNPAANPSPAPPPTLPNPAMEQTLQLKEERLVAHKEMRQVGEVEVRTIVEQVPARLEVDDYSEEVVVEHVPIGQFVDERVEPWEEDGTLVVPIYEEQLVVVKRLVLKEELRVRRIGSSERRLIEEPVRRERIVVDDPAHTGLVHERFPTEEPEGPALERHELSASEADVDDADEGGLGGLLKKMLT